MIEIIQSPLLNKFKDITHFFSTRRGGYSTTPFHWANMSLKNGDPWALRNRLQLSEILHTRLENFIFLKQIHSDNIHIATEKDAGKGAYNYQTAIDNTDALITNRQCLMLTITTADCLPVLIYDSEHKVIAAVHAGWRGAAKRITAKTIETLIKQYNSNPKNLHLAIGPGIGQCCYEVGEEVFEAFEKSYGRTAQNFFSSRNSKLFLDLHLANQHQVLELNIPQENIDLIKLCTSCNNDKFYSARCGDHGRQISGIKLLKW